MPFLFCFVTNFGFFYSFKTMLKPSHGPSSDLATLEIFRVLRQVTLRRLLGAKVDMELTPQMM